ncbi:MAG: hypothetical protein HEQ25_22145 [Dolichospermum sp. DET73]|nr:hypothetical protein [Dolichospermum sp. DET73]
MEYINGNFTNFKTQNQSPVSNNYPEKANWGLTYGYYGSGANNLDDAIREISEYSPHPHQKIKEKCLRDGHYSYGSDNGHCSIDFEGHLEEEEYIEEEAQEGDFDND